MSITNPYFAIGVDVGSASVRGGIFAFQTGKLINFSVEPINIYRKNVMLPGSENQHVETISQSSREIWAAVCKVVRNITVGDGIDVNRIVGIGFDATCSLVVLGQNDEPLNIIDYPEAEKPGNEEILDVVMWMDHRAKEETNFINEALRDHCALNFVGGKVSVEMELPKILWIKNHFPDKYKQATKFMDLCDFLTWKASGDSSRSMCAAVCKWLYQVDPTHPSAHRWDEKLLQQINLPELAEVFFEKIGRKVVNPGMALEGGISENGATDLGLKKGTPVAVGLIDAHAGAVALTFCSRPGGGLPNPCKRLALICGTSTCFMVCSEKPVFVPGVWGPYYSAIIPETWAAEGGQSASGQFLDHIIETHPYYINSLRSTEYGKLSSCYVWLNACAEELCRDLSLNDIAELSDGIHIFPDYHGNRSPLSNPDLKGMLMGLTLDGQSKLSLIKMYVAALQALAYESQWIISTIEKSGIEIEDIALCGGLANNPLFIRTLTDVVEKPTLLTTIQESVVLGSVILAATASGHFDTLQTAARAIAGSSSILQPNESTKSYHRKRYNVFLEMAKFQQRVLSDGGRSD